MAILTSRRHVDLDGYIRQRFAERQVRFYHAENLRDFRTYCAARAALCRNELMRRDLACFTCFRSDDDDAALGVLGRVFGNLYDFGAVFARAPKSAPNVYGPILLVFASSAFSVMSDIQITRASIVTHRSAWRRVAISKKEQVDALVQGDAYGSPIAPDWHFCEVSCAERSLSFDHREHIWVEPIAVCGTRLVDVVRNEVLLHGLATPVVERPFRFVPNATALNDLVRSCEGIAPGLADDQWQSHTVSLPLSFDAHPSNRRGLALGWCRYFYFGTLEEIRRQKASVTEGEDDHNRVRRLPPWRRWPTILRLVYALRRACNWLLGGGYGSW